MHEGFNSVNLTSHISLSQVLLNKPPLKTELNSHIMPIYQILIMFHFFISSQKKTENKQNAVSFN
ncbi:MAG TPA: hypothetical protein DCM28_21150 [Phycisphaerales bacterium]|nr:hypothetical protein [Phycisphaerales bacterium]HCD31311.1 hypothetical protein [Phycisphaerales bacterium]|tara:strand:+ start:1341 stop:1535 length:195 start_codon:yes stop_codon:yes gene_type:complete